MFLITDSIERKKWEGTIDSPTIVSAAENLDMLTESQRRLWEFFSTKSAQSQIIDKKDISPAELVKFLPDIWLCDLIFSDSSLVDIKLRLLGTKIAAALGERTGEKIIQEKKNPDSLYHQRFGVYQRAILSAEFIINEKKPVIYYSNHFSDEIQHYQSIGLVFPVTNKSKTINLMLGNTQLVPVK